MSSAITSLIRRLTRSQVIVLCLVACVSATVLGVSTRVLHRPATAPQSPTDVKKPDYVRVQALRWDLREELKALGDRLEKPGKERILMTGTISRPVTSGGEKVPVRLILEFPDRLRFEELSGRQTGITVFDGNDLKSSRNNLDKADEAEIESLVLDSADHFFASQMQMQATQRLGSHFRLDDGRADNYSGPFYDIYRITEKISIKKDSFRQQIKDYYFNSKTLFLEKIRYHIHRDEQPVQVETQLNGWKKINAQYLPSSLIRLENGAPTFTLSIEAIIVGKKADDGIFATQ